MAATATVGAPGARAGPAARGAVSEASVQTGSAADWQAAQWWVAKSKLKERHAQGLTGKGVNIALIDGPVSTSIPELVGQDVRPTFSTCGTREEAGPVTPDGPLNDTSFHPTSMAALLVGNGKGTGPGGAGITGVAPGATLRTYAIYNTSDPSKNQNLMCDLAAMPALIDRVVADGADIVEIPVTIQGWSDTFRAAVNRAIAKGVVLVSGAGNDGPATRPMPPADQTGVLVVGGFTSDLMVYPGNPTSSSANWEFASDDTRSRSRYEIHLLGPATSILGGTVVNGRWESNKLQNGTSGASAIVVGQFALMKQKWPKATNNQLLVSLLRNANRVPGEPVWTPRGGFGTSSFENTLTTDPSGYPDVQPIYYRLSNVFKDHPVPQFLPVTVDSDGYLPTQPPTPSATTSTTTSSATSTAPAATGSPTSPPAYASGSSSDRASGSTPGWLLGLLGALVALAFVILALMRRHRTSRSAVRLVNTSAEGKDSA